MRYFFRCLIIGLGLFISVPVLAQKFTLNGYVTDVASGERLAGASIIIGSQGTTSNTYGFYSLTLPAATDSVTVTVSFTGYDAYSFRVLFDQNIQYNMALQARARLDAVVITSARKAAIQNSTQMSSISLSAGAIKAMPAFLGEADVLKAIQLLPGVQAGSEGSSGIYVRGGGPDQNLILLDGVPVYNASHLFGFFSVFNADAVKGVDVIKGGFPARYGGRLSSIIDIQMKEGNNQQLHGEGGIGLIASRFTLEGPLKKGASSFMISGRRTYADLFLGPIAKAASGGEQQASYYFYDLNAKLNLRLGDKDHLYLSGYFGKDKFYAKENTTDTATQSLYNAAIKWGNATAVARWNHQFNPKLFSNTTVNYTNYLFDLSSEDKSNMAGSGDRYYQHYFSGISDVSARFDLDYLPSPRHFVKLGISSTWHTYKPGAFQSKIETTGYNQDTLQGQQHIQGNELDVYAEDDVVLTTKLKANLGLHTTGFAVDGKMYTSLQPRIALRYLLNSSMSLKASYAQMTQYIHLLTNSGLGLPTDLWVPATATVPPQVSRQVAAGWAYSPRNSFEVSVEAYYKTMKNVVEYKEGASFVGNGTDWETRVTNGTGESYGAEFFIQKKTGRTTGLAGYTLSWTERQFDELNSGKWFPYKYDRRHDLKLAVVHEVSKRFQVSADFVYGSGTATTIPEAVYVTGNGRAVEIYGARNGFRLPAYHRMDVGLKWSKQKKWGERAWLVNVYNVYNHLNTFFIHRETAYDAATGQNRMEFVKTTLFPIIPSISYQFKF